MTAQIVFAILFSFLLLKPNPQGLNYQGDLHYVSDVNFHYDLTYMDQGEQKVEQQIFEQFFMAIDEAETFILMDMFLFYDSIKTKSPHIFIATDLTNRLIAKKKDKPDIDIVVITDPFNTSYGADIPEHLERLKAAGIAVVITDLKKLRDSNPLYTTIWRSCIQWFGTKGKGWLPNVADPDGDKVTLRSYLSLLNFKANHRKVLLTDKIGIIGSANPHGLSSIHSNIAFSFKGPILADLEESERAVLTFSDFLWPSYLDGDQVSTGNVGIQLITEKKIKDQLIRSFDSTVEGDSIDIAMFYLSSRGIIRSLKRAAKRDVTIRLILDANKDAFGRQKGGVPNRPVASELVRRSKQDIQVRWYNTQGEQFHSKLVLVSQSDRITIFGGSANLTRRNIHNYNLEANVKIMADKDSLIASEVTSYFNDLWLNRGGSYTLDYDVYKSNSILKTVRYRFQEFSGLSTF